MSCINGRQSPYFLMPPCGDLGQLEPQRRRLILDGLVFFVSAGNTVVTVLQAAAPEARQDEMCALSSFQRTKAPPVLIAQQICVD